MNIVSMDEYMEFFIEKKNIFLVFCLSIFLANFYPIVLWITILLAVYLFIWPYIRVIPYPTFPEFLKLLLITDCVINILFLIFKDFLLPLELLLFVNLCFLFFYWIGRGVVHLSKILNCWMMIRNE